VEENDDKGAKELMKERGLHFSDVLHAALAIRTKATIVTRNIKHFRCVAALERESITGKSFELGGEGPKVKIPLSLAYYNALLLEKILDAPLSRKFCKST